MSIAAMTWALTNASVESAQEHVILIALADRANDDGTSAWPSQDWIAQRARCSTRTVRRHLRALEDRGIICRGDQSLVEHLRADSRPIVWDLTVESVAAVDRPVDDARTRMSARPTRAERPDTGDRSGRTLLSDKPSLDSSSEPSTTPHSPSTSPTQRAPRRMGVVVVNRSADGNLDDLATACRDAGLTARWDALKPEQCDAIAGLLDTHGIASLVASATQAHRPSNPTRYAQGYIGVWSTIQTQRVTQGPPTPAELRRTCSDCVGGWVEDAAGLPIRRCSCRQAVAA